MLRDIRHNVQGSRMWDVDELDRVFLFFRGFIKLILYHDCLLYNYDCLFNPL